MVWCGVEWSGLLVKEVEERDDMRYVSGLRRKGWREERRREGMKEGKDEGSREETGARRQEDKIVRKKGR